MLPNDRAQPAAPEKPSWGARLMRAHRRAPTWLKVTVVAAAVLFFPAHAGPDHPGRAGLRGRRGGPGTAHRRRLRLGRGLGLGRVLSAVYNGSLTSWLYSLLLLPFAVALAAHARPLARWFVPCRTVAWVLVWSVPVGVIALKVAAGPPFIGTIAAWLLAAAVLGWRVAKGIQDARMYGRGPSARYPSTDRGQARVPGQRRASVRTGGHASHPGPASTGPPSRATASGPRPRRCPTPSRPPATTRAAGTARSGRGRRSRSRTPWPSSTR